MVYGFRGVKRTRKIYIFLILFFGDILGAELGCRVPSVGRG